MTISSRGYRRVAIADVIERHVERYDDPDADGLSRYVKVEHFDLDSLRLARWGHLDDGQLPPTFKFVFRQGMVLYPSRSPNLRQYAIPDFDGICGEKTFVVKSRDPTVLLPELLPFVFSADALFRHCNAVAIGSVNAHVRWRDLADFQFSLPPMGEQRRVADALKAAQRCQDALDDLSERGVSARESLVDHRMRGLQFGEPAYDERVGRYCGDWSLVPLGELLTAAQYGLSESLQGSGQYPVLRMMNLKDGRATADDLKYLALSDSEFETYRLVRGDVLFNRTNSYELVGRTGVYDLAGDFVFASYLVRLRTKLDCLLPEYLCAFLRAPIGRRQVMSFATRGVSQTNVNVSNLRRVLVPVPPIGYQEELVEVLGAVEATRREAKSRRQAAKALAAKLINGALAG